jgi:hypothetical protein
VDFYYLLEDGITGMKRYGEGTGMKIFEARCERCDPQAGNRGAGVGILYLVGVVGGDVAVYGTQDKIFPSNVGTTQKKGGHYFRRGLGRRYTGAILGRAGGRGLSRPLFSWWDSRTTAIPIRSGHRPRG